MLKKINKIYLICTLCLWACVHSSSIFALGVPANTAISNSATISYDVSGEIVTNTITTSFTVLELLDITAVDPTQTLMIGDTTYDMEMAGNANRP